MCAGGGCQVLSLKRVRIMNIELGSRELGVYRKSYEGGVRRIAGKH